MDVFSSLETTAEIAVTFAGFISIFLVLARREGPLALEVATLIRFILIQSLAITFIAFLPLIAAGIGLSGTLLWRAAGYLGLAVGMGVLVLIVNQRRKLAYREVTIFVNLGWILAPLGFSAHLANITGWPVPPNGGIYLFGIWLYLGVTAVHLIDLVFRFALRTPSD